jgi:hypothetical protein
MLLMTVRKVKTQKVCAGMIANFLASLAIRQRFAKKIKSYYAQATTLQARWRKVVRGHLLNVLTLKKRMIEYRTLVKESIYLVGWVKRKFGWYVDEMMRCDCDPQNYESAFHRVAVEHLKERHIIFKMNMGR